MLRLLLFGLYPLRALYVPILVFAALLTLTTGNLAAITQTNTKRLLAYSSIAHVGYMLLGLVASDGVSNRTGIKGILFYLLVYTFMNIGAFAVLTSLRRRKIVGDNLDDLDGLFQKAPIEALLMLVFLLSLAGIPPLAGFYGKYFIFLSLIETGHYHPGIGGGALHRGGRLLLPENGQRDVHGHGGQRGTGSVHCGHERCAAVCRYGHGRHRAHAKHLHPCRGLVSHQPWPGRNCHAEVTCETQLFTRRISSDHCLSAFFLKHNAQPFVVR